MHQMGRTRRLTSPLCDVLVFPSKASKGRPGSSYIVSKSFKFIQNKGSSFYITVEFMEERDNKARSQTSNKIRTWRKGEGRVGDCWSPETNAQRQGRLNERSTSARKNVIRATSDQWGWLAPWRLLRHTANAEVFAHPNLWPPLRPLINRR